MSLEDRYAALLNETQLIWLSNYSFNKERGTLGDWLDFYIQVQKKLLRKDLRYAKVLKKIAPGATFRRMTETLVYSLQRYMPVSHIDLAWVSEKKAVLTITECPLLKNYKELIAAAGFQLDPKFVCDCDLKIYPIIAKELGIDLTYQLQNDGCQLIGSLP